jgi:glutamyl-Q tRNA(Asp) synthetase
MPLHCDARLTQRTGRDEQRLRRDHLVGVAVKKQNGRCVRPLLRKSIDAGQHTGKAYNRRGLSRATQSHMQGHHRALAETNQCETVRPQFEPLQFGLEKCLERGCCLLNAFLRLVRIEPRDGKPLIARRRARAALGRIGRDESGRGQQALPMRRQADEIVSVGAVTVTEHDQMRRPSARRRQARTAEHAIAKYQRLSLPSIIMGSMIVTRFAPSPTGYLHLGHAFAALTARAAAVAAGGRFLLRIEDIDTARSREEFATAIFEDLHWLGLKWEEPVLRQSTRYAAYRAALNGLDARGLLYPCFCTRAEIAAEIARASEAPHGPEGAQYPGMCRTRSDVDRRARIASGEPYALRLDCAQAAAGLPSLTFVEEGAGPLGETGTIAVDPLLFGDIVLARKETPSSYHLAVVIDDAYQDVSLVTRGRDLFAATHVQRLLQALLDLPAPLYAHHRLILGEDGRKFSKRDRSVTLRDLRAAGAVPAEIRARLGCG